MTIRRDQPVGTGSIKYPVLTWPELRRGQDLKMTSLAHQGALTNDGAGKAQRAPASRPHWIARWGRQEALSGRLRPSPPPHTGPAALHGAWPISAQSGARSWAAGWQSKSAVKACGWHLGLGQGAAAVHGDVAPCHSPASISVRPHTRSIGLNGRVPSPLAAGLEIGQATPSRSLFYGLWPSQRRSNKRLGLCCLGDSHGTSTLGRRADAMSGIYSRVQTYRHTRVEGCDVSARSM